MLWCRIEAEATIAAVTPCEEDAIGRDRERVRRRRRNPGNHRVTAVTRTCTRACANARCVGSHRRAAPRAAGNDSAAMVGAVGRVGIRYRLLLRRVQVHERRRLSILIIS